MKKVKLLALGLLLMLSYNCKEVKKEAKSASDKVVNKETYTVRQDSTIIKFTAYKTTDKKPVGGKFTSIELKNIETKTSAIDALNGLKFAIPVSSLFTNDATGTRDPKIIDFFFGAMKDTEFISGTFKFDDQKKCLINLKLNGISFNLPMEYTITDNRRFSFKGVLNLENWSAMGALASLNKVCAELHTGEDGISKTWNDIAIEATTYLE